MVSLSPPSLQILGNISDGGDSDFHISGQSFINKNYGNSRTSHDIDMKLGPGTKIYKRNKATPIKFDDDIVFANYDVIVLFSIYGQFEAIRKPFSRSMAYKTYIFINSNLFPYKNWKQN